MTALDLSSEITGLPTDPWSDEPPLESDLHLQQIIILLTGLELLWRERNDYYASGNLTIYYNEEQLKKRDFLGPDFFVVLDTEKRPRKSWVVWAEGGKYPDVIVEILSDSTARVDKTKKKDLYQNVFRTSNYFWFDPESLEFQGFNLQNRQYQPIPSDERGYLWSDRLGLYLGVFEGKLRYFTESGELVPTPEEFGLQAVLEKERAVLEKERAILEKERVILEREREQKAKEKLARKLREIGIDPDTI